MEDFGEYFAVFYGVRGLFYVFKNDDSIGVSTGAIYSHFTYRARLLSFNALRGLIGK